MDHSTVAVMQKLASKNLKLKDAKFLNFEKVDIDEIHTLSDDEVENLLAHVEIWANFNIGYEGELPSSYRVINAMIQDWVDENEEKLKKEINPKLIGFLHDHYRDIDTSDLREDFDDYIWEDQVDYMPDVDEDKKRIQFTVELVLDVTEEEQDE